MYLVLRFDYFVAALSLNVVKPEGDQDEKLSLPEAHRLPMPPASGS